VNAYRHATEMAFYNMCEVAVQRAERYEARLGTDFLNRLTDLKNAYHTAYGYVTGEKGELSHDKAERQSAITALQLQLMVNICTIGIYNAGNPEKGSAYFAAHLLFPAKRHHLFKAKIEAGQTKQVCTFKYSEGKRFHIMVTGEEPLEFQMMKNGVSVGRHVMVKPAEKFNETFGFFSSAGDTLTVTNPSDKRGSYMVWEIT
jgi:hypothetical protein